MATKPRDTVLQNLDQRLGRVEQFLPALATRGEVGTAVGDEAARTDRRFDELLAALRAEDEQTRRHVDEVAEALGVDIRAGAECSLGLQKRVSTLETRHARDVTALDGRLTPIERQRRGRLR